MHSRFRRRLTGLVAALAVVGAACGGGAGQSATITTDGTTTTGKPGDPVPTTELAMFDGTTVTLASYAGRPLVVNFWASWCPSCVAEMSAAFRPAQQALGDQVAFLGVNIQDDRARAVELVEATGVRFDLAEDPTGALYAELGGLGMPFTVFISAEGLIRDVHNGPLTEGRLIDRITELLLP